MVVGRVTPHEPAVATLLGDLASVRMTKWAIELPGLGA